MSEKARIKEAIRQKTERDELERLESKTDRMEEELAKAIRQSRSGGSGSSGGGGSTSGGTGGGY